MDFLKSVPGCRAISRQKPPQVLWNSWPCCSIFNLSFCYLNHHACYYYYGHNSAASVSQVSLHTASDLPYWPEHPSAWKIRSQSQPCRPPMQQGRRSPYPLPMKNPTGRLAFSTLVSCVDASSMLSNPATAVYDELYSNPGLATLRARMRYPEYSRVDHYSFDYRRINAARILGPRKPSDLSWTTELFKEPTDDEILRFPHLYVLCST